MKDSDFYDEYPDKTKKPRKAQRQPPDRDGQRLECLDNKIVSRGTKKRKS